ncbi:MAG: N-acetylmuramoyl-L-alanine amidase [Thermomicrobiales bacterium]|nr:N-acetylmuramoyl-L-alanine amidase [Thermomicrobiales bacterium]
MEGPRVMPRTTDVTIKGPASATIDYARAWTRQRNAARLADVDAYLSEIWRLAPRIGYDPAVVAAQSSCETEGWTSEIWRTRLNPAQLGIGEAADCRVSFVNGTDGARAHLVHLSAFVRGYESRLRQFISLDPCWQKVFESGAAGRAQSLADLVPWWSADPGYPASIAVHLCGLREAFKAPVPTPQPTPGGAALPPNIERIATGNWRERTFGQEPLAIVYHITDDPDRDRALSWYRNPASRASMHAIVDRDGTITQLVSSTRAAWANGDVKNPRRDVPWLNDAVGKSRAAGGPMGLDDFTLAAAYVGSPTAPPTEAQYRSLIALSAYWRDRYAIPPGRSRLLRHSDINSVDRVHCPGARFDLNRLVLALGGDPSDLSA